MQCLLSTLEHLFLQIGMKLTKKRRFITFFITVVVVVVLVFYVISQIKKIKTFPRTTCNYYLCARRSCVSDPVIIGGPVTVRAPHTNTHSLPFKENGKFPSNSIVMVCVTMTTFTYICVRFLLIFFILSFSHSIWRSLLQWGSLPVQFNILYK